MAKERRDNNVPIILKWAGNLEAMSKELYNKEKEYPSAVEMRKMLLFSRSTPQELFSLYAKYPKINRRFETVRRELGEYAYKDLASDFNVCTLVELWNRNKQIYAFDTDFLDELLATETISMTKNAWDYLPYDTFFIDLSQNKTLYDMLGYGMFVKVEKDWELDQYIVYICRITDTLYFGDAFMQENGDYEKTVDKSKIRSIPTFADPLRNDETKTLVIQQNGTAEINDGLYKSVIIQILTYLSSIEPDIKESETTKRTYRKPAENSTPKNKFSEVRMWNVGEDFGISYRNWKKAHETSSATHSDGESRGAGIKKRPHSRRAHWSHYWYGTGENKVRRPKWLSATFVNSTVKEENGLSITTVRK